MAKVVTVIVQTCWSAGYRATCPYYESASCFHPSQKTGRISGRDIGAEVKPNNAQSWVPQWCPLDDAPPDDKLAQPTAAIGGEG